MAAMFDSGFSVVFSPDGQQITSGSGENDEYACESGYRLGYGLSTDQRWICRHEQNVLWLPPDYRLSSSAVWCPSCLFIPTGHSAGTMDDEYEVRYPRTIQFRSGRVLVINAEASLADHGLHPNVLTATLRPSFLYGILVAIVCRLPSCLQALLRHFWPILFLPKRFILKKKKNGWDDEFDNEKAMYARPEAFQGALIPICYGEVEFEGSRALVMSVIDGRKLSEVTDLTVERVKELAESALLPLQHHGVVPDDMKLDNFILVREDRLVLIDLEHVDEPDIPEMTETAKSAVLMLLDNYKACQSAASMDW
ncbi:hypothetical protein VUR80DRAFT_1888 [Thermomyces stellatus]